MTKRIVSGIFILTALGALGVILAGALTSGEQLIVRFLTAVIVAALGLYVISDLRLQADDDAKGARSTGQTRRTSIDAPPNSTAAFMATVTRKGDSNGGTLQVFDDQDAPAEDERFDPHQVGVGATSSSTSEQYVSAVVEDVGSLDGPPIPMVLGPAPVTLRAEELPPLVGHTSAPGGSLFARSEPGSVIVDEPSWPSSADERSDHEVDHDDRAGDPLSFPAPEPIEAVAPSVIPPTHRDLDLSDDESAEPVAVTEFSYSGEIDVPDFEWPAAPEQPSFPGEPNPVEAVEDLAEFDAERPVDGFGTETGSVDVVEAIDAPAPSSVHLDDFPLTATFPATAPLDPAFAEGDADDRAEGDADDRAEGDADDRAEGDGGPAAEEILTISMAEPIDPAPDADTIDEADPPGVDIGIPADEWFRGGSSIEQVSPADGAETISAEAISDEVMAEEVGEPVEPPRPFKINGTHRPLPSPFLERASLSAADYADAPLAPIIDLRDVATTTGAGIESAIRSGEIEVITALIEQGMLSTAGPISDRDVRTMVYVAFTSNELRKLLLAGGSPKGGNPGIDLGPVELFDNGIEAPKTFYPGLPMQSEARSQLG